MEFLADGSAELADIHDTLCVLGDTDVKSADAVVHHFVCFTEANGHLIELDGAYKEGPAVCGEVGDAGLLKAAAEYIQATFLAGAESLGFSLLAIAKTG